MHILQILSVSLALVFLANSAPLNSVSQDNPSIYATWSDFQTRHIVSDSGYAQWTKAQWNTLLRNRIGSQYGSKSVKSFVIGTATNIRNDITAATLKHDKASNLWWSGNKYTVYVMKLNGSAYDAYRCPNQGNYFLAGVDNNTSKVPVHFDAQSESRPSTGSLPLNLTKCSKVA